MEQALEKIWELATIYGIKALLALLILFFGRLMAKLIAHIVERLMVRGKVDHTIVKFVGSLTYIALLAFVVIAALNQLGIQTASFIAVLAAAGLAIGLALQGSLSNFASGFLMIIFRPFKVGDYIEGGGVAGTVKEITIFTTVLTSPDNKTIIVPNAKLTEDNIINYTVQGTRRLDLTLGISYGDDIDKARNVIREVLSREKRILPSPEPLIAVAALADSSVNFVARPWVKAGDYWDVHFFLTENIKKAFDANGISIPFPQRDVHVYEHKGKD